jgi:hypothetical protein
VNISLGAKIPPSIRDKEAQASGQVDMVTFAETVGSIRLNPFNCSHCHKQYASNAKLLQHIRKKHPTENEPKVKKVASFDEKRMAIFLKLNKFIS